MQHLVSDVRQFFHTFLRRDDQNGEATVASVRLVPAGILLLALPPGLVLLLAVRPETRLCRRSESVKYKSHLMQVKFMLN
jgi:hypothetical protein